MTFDFPALIDEAVRDGYAPDRDAGFTLINRRRPCDPRYRDAYATQLAGYELRLLIDEAKAFLCDARRAMS